MNAVIVCNGHFVQTTPIAAILDQADLLIGADGGSNHLAAINRIPQVVIGDMDSISEKTARLLADHQVEYIRHPPDKDASDLELALDLAQERGASTITVLGALGGRWDMSLANVLQGTADKYAQMRIELLAHDSHFLVLHPPGPYSFDLGHDRRFSLLPLGGPVARIRLDGCRYPLADATLTLGSSRGVSNIATAKSVTLSFASGILLLITEAVAE